MTRKYALVIIASIMAVGAWQLMSDASCHVVTYEADSGDASLAQSVAKPAVSLPPEPVPDRNELVPSDDIRIVVTGEGAPLGSAAIYQWAPGRTVQARPLLVADADGLVYAERQQVTGRKLVACAAGWLPRELPPAQHGRHDIHVDLERGKTLQLTCTDFADKPVAGITIAVSQGSSQNHHGVQPMEGSMPGFDATHSIYRAKTDAHGTAVLSGLSKGHYALGIEGSEWFVAKTSWRGSLKVAGDLAGSVVVAQLVAAGVEFSGDRVISSNYQWIHGADDARQAAEDARQILRKRFPRAEIVVGVPVRALKGVLRGSFLLGNSGWLDLDLPVSPIADFSGPLVVAPPSTTAGRVAMGRVKVEFAGPRGRVEGAGALLVWKNGRGHRLVAREVSSGDEVELPVGDYFLRVPDRLLSSLASSHPTTIEVRDGACVTVPIQIPIDVMMCTVHVGNGSETLPATNIDIDVAGQRIRHNLDRGSRKAVPVGVAFLWEVEVDDGRRFQGSSWIGEKCDPWTVTVR